MKGLLHGQFINGILISQSKWDPHSKFKFCFVAVATAQVFRKSMRVCLHVS